MKKLLFVLLLVASPVFARGLREDISEVGPHYPIFTFEKSINRENIMEIYTKADANCNLELTLDRKNNPTPVFDFYWLMNRERYKPVYSGIKNGIRQRLEIQMPTDPALQKQQFWLKLTDLKEMNHDLEDPRLLVKARRDAATQACVVEGFVKLGPSDANAVIRLDMIYGESEGFSRVIAVTLDGVNTVTGQRITRVYQGK